MTAALMLNVAGLIIGLVAAILMYYFPPRGTLYTEKGEPYITVLSKATDEGKRRGRNQLLLSKSAPMLLAIAFLLQLIAAFLPTS